MAGRAAAAGAAAAHGAAGPRPLLLPLVLAFLARGVCGGVSKDAVAHVQCQVCEQAASEAVDFAKENAIKDEDGLADMVEGLCSSKKKEGRWVARYDVTRKGADAQLAIERQDGLGNCNSECLIIIRACEAALKGQDDALTSLLLAGKDARQIRKKIREVLRQEEEAAQAPAVDRRGIRPQGREGAGDRGHDSEDEGRDGHGHEDVQARGHAQHVGGRHGGDGGARGAGAGAGRREDEIHEM
ncbi:unnamed protein product [Prorocentrum cordatum]|uniref:Saposin B-type domain-containing protein n=1 Tax=Prorocentrum cordatum TaxID=2364126 RepID=A0ABN9SV98_9DINO|nr:unnamed protein product [Polarella glacialis]